MKLKHGKLSTSMEIEGGYLRTTYSKSPSASTTKMKKEFIAKKEENSIQPHEGWAIMKNAKVGLKHRHFFRKNDKLSLCGTVILTIGNVIVEKDPIKKCGQCQRVLDTYKDLNNFNPHRDEYKYLRSQFKMEW